MYTKNKAEYAKAVMQIAQLYNEEVANSVNHRMLEQKLVSLELFQAAAQELANLILNRP